MSVGTNGLRIGLARAYALGAALAFVLSLATLVVLDRRLSRDLLFADQPSFRLADILIDLTLFSAFALHHSVMARSGLKAWLTPYVHAALERSTYVWIASALFAAVCLLWRPAPQVLYTVEAPWAWLLTAVRLVGLGMTIEAASRIDPRELAGLRQAWTYGVPPVTTTDPAGGGRSTGGRPETKPADRVGDGALVSRGGYRLVRHPLYLGWILMMWGVPIVTAGRLTFAAVSTFYLLIAIPLEERSLRERYGRAYRDYESTVRWRVLPGLY